MNDDRIIVDYATAKTQPAKLPDAPPPPIPVAYPYVEPTPMVNLMMTCLVMPVLIVVGILVFLYFNLPSPS